MGPVSAAEAGVMPPESAAERSDASLEKPPGRGQDAGRAPTTPSEPAPISTEGLPDGALPAMPTDASSLPADSEWLTFDDVARAAGIGAYTMASGPRAGIAAEDFDEDGWVDLFVPTGQAAQDQLYRNLGDGTFENVATRLGLDSRSKHRTALWFDADGDEDLDLVIASDCRALLVGNGAACESGANLWLYRQDAAGRFSDATEASGLTAAWGGTNTQHRAGMAAGDLDDDGDLDLVVPGWNMTAYVFRNEGDGSFVDVTAEVGLPADRTEFYQRATIHDFNQDGYQDILLTVDIFDPNALYLNQQDGRFIDVAVSAGVANESTDMGATIGDYDNDGDFDFYVTVITQDDFSNPLYRNDSTDDALSYSNVGQALGVESAGWAWGCSFFDADNDGWLDLAVTNGSNSGTQYRTDPSRFWRNPGLDGGRFLDVSEDVGFDDRAVASGLIAFDYDGDGDLDMVQAMNDGGPLRLLRNDRGSVAAENSYLVVRPRQAGPNHWAIGAKVEARVGELRMSRPILAGTSTDSQEPAEAHFGLGEATSVDEVIVTWPGSERETTVLTDVAANQVITVTR